MGFGSGPIREQPGSAKFIERIELGRMNTDSHGYQEMAKDFFFFVFSLTQGAFICVYLYY